jgi:hypothetical protein
MIFGILVFDFICAASEVSLDFQFQFLEETQLKERAVIYVQILCHLKASLVFRQSNFIRLQRHSSKLRKLQISTKVIKYLTWTHSN